ncbi:MAG: LysR family transcriptional regulator [Alphaproteobacteria bacterium]
MEIRHIHFIRAVADCGSVSAAARRLGLTQSALTKIVARVEDELGTRLFDRGTHGMSANKYGQLFLDRTRQVGLIVDDLATELRTLKSGISGTVRVGSGRAWLSTVLPAAIVRCTAAYPNVEVVLRHADYASMVDELRRGDLDFVLAQVREGAAQEEFSIDPVRTNHSMITTRKDHPLTRKPGALSANDLAEYRWILPPKEDPSRQFLIRKMMELGAPPPLVQVEAVSYQLTASILLQSDMLSIIPDHQRPVYVGQLTTLNTPWCTPKKRAGIVTLRGRSLSGASLNLLNDVRAIAREMER